MKKRYFAGLALALALTGVPATTTAQTMSETATQEIYDFSGFDVQKMLDLFYAAEQDGRKYPTMEEFEAAGIQASDIAFVRSHVRKAEILDRSDRLRPETYEKRNLFMNIPMDVGSGGAAGYPNDKFAADVYSMWQYTNLFGSWNHGFFQAPGAWVDAAHRNGTKIMSGIAFFESWTPGSGDGAYSNLITQMVNGEFKYVKPLINYQSTNLMGTFVCNTSKSATLTPLLQTSVAIYQSVIHNRCSFLLLQKYSTRFLNFCQANK
jgi:endo-beta-N-acetylglucosaminidase D